MTDTLAIPIPLDRIALDIRAALLATDAYGRPVGLLAQAASAAAAREHQELSRQIGESFHRVLTSPEFATRLDAAVEAAILEAAADKVRSAIKAGKAPAIAPLLERIAESGGGR